MTDYTQFTTEQLERMLKECEIDKEQIEEMDLAISEELAHRSAKIWTDQLLDPLYKFLKS